MPSMRLIASCFVAACLAGAASSDTSANVMADIHAAGHWSGCVYQEGFAPYPIRISPRPAPTLKVEYPGLCTGYHAPRQKGWPSDAVEVIPRKPGICIPSVDLNYSFDGEYLRIDYLIEGDAYALLKSVAPDSETLSCEPSEVSS